MDVIVNKIGLTLVLVTMLLSGCATDTVQYDGEDKYTPGYTAYTISDEGYGEISNGYGPAFWNPPYHYYNGYGGITGQSDSRNWRYNQLSGTH